MQPYKLRDRRAEEILTLPFDENGMSVPADSPKKVGEVSFGLGSKTGLATVAIANASLTGDKLRALVCSTVTSVSGLQDRTGKPVEEMTGDVFEDLPEWMAMELIEAVSRLEGKWAGLQGESKGRRNGSSGPGTGSKATASRARGTKGGEVVAHNRARSTTGRPRTSS